MIMQNSMNDLVKITEEEFGVKLDIKYATKDNVCKKALYTKPLCFLHKDAIKPLKTAIELAKTQGLKLKIFDTYRPLEVQKFMYQQFSGDKYQGFISDPASGPTPHCRGAAIDLTLIDESEKELEMGSDFDEFSDLAYHANQKISIIAQKNRFILMGIMLSSGWDFYSQEWWHYQLFNPRNYPIIAADRDLIAI
jgi:D-alanyl-D-alanine dipeptidase